MNIKKIHMYLHYLNPKDLRRTVKVPGRCIKSSYRIKYIIVESRAIPFVRIDEVY